MSANMSNMG